MKVLLCLVLVVAGTNATLLNLFAGAGSSGGGVNKGGLLGGGNRNNEVHQIRILTPIPIVQVQGRGGHGGGGGGHGYARNLHGNGHNEVVIVKLIHQNAGPRSHIGGPPTQERVVRLIHIHSPPPSHNHIENSGAVGHNEERVIRIIHEHAPAAPDLSDRSLQENSAVTSSSGSLSNAEPEQIVRIIEDSSLQHLSNSALLPPLPPSAPHSYLPPHTSDNHHHHYY